MWDSLDWHPKSLSLHFDTQRTSIGLEKKGFFKVESMNMVNEEAFHVHLHVKTIRVCELLEKYVNFARWHGISRH